MKRTIMTNTDTFEQPNTGANEESLRMVSAAPVGNEPVSDEEIHRTAKAQSAVAAFPRCCSKT